MYNDLTCAVFNQCCIIFIRTIFYFQIFLKNFQQTIDNKYRSWRTNALNKEVEEWWKDASPQSDSDGHFNTEAPIIIFKMVGENLQLAETVGYFKNYL